MLVDYKITSSSLLDNGDTVVHARFYEGEMVTRLRESFASPFQQELRTEYERATLIAFPSRLLDPARNQGRISADGLVWSFLMAPTRTVVSDLNDLLALDTTRTPIDEQQVQRV